MIRALAENRLCAVLRAAAHPFSANGAFALLERRIAPFANGATGGRLFTNGALRR